MAVPSFVAVADTETTGIDPKEAKIVEVALFNDYGVTYNTLVNPLCPIPPETSAVHHICDADVEGLEGWEIVRPSLQSYMKTKGVTTLVAHNAEYDRTVLGPTFDVAWICTYKCALRQWPDAPSHKNEVLRYWLGLGDLGRQYAQGSHSALHDAKVTYLILEELLKHQPFEKLLQWSNEPKYFSKISFGKHAGKKWAEIDSGYLGWMTKQTDMDPDIKACAQRELDRRR